jgi:hypothetical protein
VYLPSSEKPFPMLHTSDSKILQKWYENMHHYLGYKLTYYSADMSRGILHLPEQKKALFVFKSDCKHKLICKTKL